MPNLPVHPTMLHPLTGLPIHALAISPRGKVLWPQMGGDDTVKPVEKPEEKPAEKTDEKPNNELGFPQGKPVAEMTLSEQTAYWKHQAKKHEGRNSDLMKLTGNKYGDDLKADLDELEKLRDEKRTQAEKDVNAAKKTTRDETAAEYGVKNVRTAFELLLGDMPSEELESKIEVLDLSKFLTTAGDVDTAKVRSFASTLSSSDKGQDDKQRRRDYGGGSRGGQTSTGVAAGRSRYQERHGKADKADA